MDDKSKAAVNLSSLSSSSQLSQSKLKQTEFEKKPPFMTRRKFETFVNISHY